MPRYITKQTYAEKKKSFKGKDYVVYHYLLDDGQTITSLQRYSAGDRVETWFDDNWGIPKMRPYSGTEKEV